MNEEIKRQIEADVTSGETEVQKGFEKELENSAKESIKKLQEKWKLSNEEVQTIYTTNYKKLLSGKLDNVSILTQKVKDLDTITNKLLATYMAKQREAQKNNENPSWGRRSIYRALDIDKDISKNSAKMNVLKWVIDELASIPEMIREMIKHPIDTTKAIYNALVKNFSATMAEIGKQYMNIFSGLWTPEDQYNTGRSATLIILTLFPWGFSKTALNAWKSALRAAGKVASTVGKAATTLGKEGLITWTKTIAKEATKWAISGAKEVAKWVVSSTKNGINSVKNGVKSWIESVKNSPKNIVNIFKKKPSAEYIKIENATKQLTDDVTKLKNNISTLKGQKSQLGKEVKDLQARVDTLNKKKKLTKAEKQELTQKTNDLATKQSEIKAIDKNINTENTVIQKKQREINQNNTKLGLDNNKLNHKAKELKALEKQKNTLTSEKTKLTQLQKDLDAATKANNTKEIARLNKAINKTNTKIKDLETNIAKKTKEVNAINTKLTQKELKSLGKDEVLQELIKKGFTREMLTNLVKLPLKHKLFQSIKNRIHTKINIKKIKKELFDVEDVLKKNAGKGSIDDLINKAKNTPSMQGRDEIIKLADKQTALKKSLEEARVMSKSQVREIGLQVSDLSIIGGMVSLEAQKNIKLAMESEASLLELYEYLSIDNEQTANLNENKNGLRSGSVEFEDTMAKSDYLNGLSEEELSKVKITITGKASKTWSISVNERLATQRAKAMKEQLLKIYPGLKEDHILLKTAVQAQDSEDDIANWQGADLNITWESKTYIAGYDEVKSKYNELKKESSPPIIPKDIDTAVAQN